MSLKIDSSRDFQVGQKVLNTQTGEKGIFLGYCPEFKALGQIKTPDGERWVMVNVLEGGEG